MTSEAVTLLINCLAPPTCVEDGVSKRRRHRLVQQQLPQHHPGGISGESPLQEPHPKETEVAMETERDQGDVPRVGPVDVLPPREPLMDQVPPSEQAAVQRDVGGPGEPADVS